MAYDIGARIGIEGEKDYKRAITEIGNSQKVLRSEMELLAAQFEGQEDSVEALTKKHDLLERTLYTQQDKVDALRAALQNAAASFGEADNRTMKWQDQLNKAETELIRTNNQLKKTNEVLNGTDNAFEKAGDSLDSFTNELSDSKSGTTGLGDALDQIGGKLGISLPGEMKNTLNGLGQINVKTLAVAGGMAALAAAIVGMEKKLISLTKEAAAYVDGINTLSATSGISTQKLQEYAYAAELLDVSVDKLSQSHIEVTKSMNDAMHGSSERIEAFNRLGVTYAHTNGVMRDSEEVFWEVIDALGKVENETQRDALAMKILSESATELNPLIEAGSGKMREYAEEAHKMGYVLDDEALAALQGVDDAMQRFGKTTDGVKNQLSAEFAPYLEESTEKLTTFVGNLGKALQDSGVVDAFGMLLETFTEILIPADYLADDAVPRLTQALHPLAQTIALIADTMMAIAGVVEMLWGVLPFNWGSGHFTSGIDNIKTAWGWNTKNGKPSNMYKLENRDALAQSDYDEALGGWAGNVSSEQLKKETEMKDAYQMLQDLYKQSGFNGSFKDWRTLNGYATGTDYFRGGVTWVGENGPEKVFLPQGSRILTAQESRNEGNTIIYVTIDAKNVREFNDVVKIAQEARMKARKA